MSIGKTLFFNTKWTILAKSGTKLPFNPFLGLMLVILPIYLSLKTVAICQPQKDNICCEAKGGR